MEVRVKTPIWTGDVDGNAAKSRKPGL